MKQLEKETIKSYSFLWDKEDKQRYKNEKTHFEVVQNVLPVPIVKGHIGLEIGCGPTFDIEFMAHKYPENKFFTIDINNFIFEAKKILKKCGNIRFVRASALELTFGDKKFDFVYSFGVLHHTINPEKGIQEINRVLKDNASVTLYLYENHEDNKILCAKKCYTGTKVYNKTT